MLNMTDLNVFQKYCDNQVNCEQFLDMMLRIYADENYIKPLWPMFTNNPTRFITTRNEKKLLSQINNRIKNEDYHG